MCSRTQVTVCSVSWSSALLDRQKLSHNWTGIQKMVSKCVLHIDMNFRSEKKMGTIILVALIAHHTPGAYFFIMHPLKVPVHKTQFCFTSFVTVCEPWLSCSMCLLSFLLLSRIGPVAWKLLIKFTQHFV
jgi:hypothetical protein